MDESFAPEGVRTRLILAGISELEEHGLTDFSLRRAAVLAQVSCAAPYRHFKDKDEYIQQIIKYVNSRWELLAREIEKIYASDPAQLAVQMCVASLKFRIANSNFRSVFTLAARDGEANVLDNSIALAVGRYADSRGLSEKERTMKIYTAKALVAGSLMLVGDSGAERITALARERLEEEFKA